MAGTILDPLNGAIVQNDSDVPTDDVIAEIRSDQRLLAQFTQWTNEASRGQSYAGYGGSGRNRAGGLFERDRYVTPSSVYQQMRMAYDAVESDDVVSGVADTTEALAFSRVSMFAEDADEEDVYNQIAADLDLDSRLREMWRELFTCSQFYATVWWGNKSYKVRGTTERGNSRRKGILVNAPTAISLLDPLKVVPVGNTMFNTEQLAYIADRNEGERFDEQLRDRSDPIIGRLIMGRYEASPDEKKWMGAEGIDADNLFLMNPATVFRHTLTRPQFKRLAAVRMKSVFELLDLKHQLRSMDRAHLIGGTNFIVLIKKGTDQMPGKPAEISNLQEQVRTIARLPVLVGDHRLSVEIITPKMDATLDAARYSAVDARITARLYGMFVLGGRAGNVGASSDDSGSLMKIVARGIESRRHMMKRTLERNVFSPLFQQNEALGSSPKLKFHPKSIDLTFDPGFASFLMELRQSNELSRETLLSQFDIDQADEAQMLQREEEQYDQIFQTQVPFSTPNPRNGSTDPAADPTNRTAQRQAGRTGGGTRNGGGAAPGTGQGQDPINPQRTSG